MTSSGLSGASPWIIQWFQRWDHYIKCYLVISLLDHPVMSLPWILVCSGSNVFIQSSNNNPLSCTETFASHTDLQRDAFDTDLCAFQVFRLPLPPSPTHYREMQRQAPDSEEFVPYVWWESECTGNIIGVISHVLDEALVFSMDPFLF